MRGKEFLLIGTKLNRPDIGNRSIVRPRLISRLNEGLDKRITLISAPAGFGKTTSQSNGSLQAPCVQHGCRWRVTTASRSVSLGMSLPPSGLLSRSSWKSLGASVRGSVAASRIPSRCDDLGGGRARRSASHRWQSARKHLSHC